MGLGLEGQVCGDAQLLPEASGKGQERAEGGSSISGVGKELRSPEGMDFLPGERSGSQSAA